MTPDGLRARALYVPPVLGDARQESTGGDSVFYGHRGCGAPIRKAIRLPRIRSARCFVLRNSASTPAAESRHGDARLSCGVQHKRPVAHSCVGSCIPHLLGMSSPPAVLRRVVAVHVDPVNREVVGVPATPGPRSELLVAVSPRVADADATASVVFPGRVVRVCASGFHASPDAKQTAVRLPVRRSLIPGKIDSIAPARFNSFVSQFLRVCVHQHTAITLTAPNRRAVAVRSRAMECHETAESLPSDVLQCCEFSHE